MARTFDGSRKSAKLAVSTIVENPRNPRVHDEQQLDGLVASLSHFGQARPILVRAANKMIVGGHAVFEASKRAGLAEIDVILWNVDQKTVDEFMIADNRHHDRSSDDRDRIASLLRDLEPENYLALGFDEDEVADIFGEEDEAQVFEVDTSAVEDRFWISIAGPLPMQAEVLRLLQETVGALDDIEVELGTTESV